MKNFIKKLLKKDKRDFIPVKKIGILEHIAFCQHDLLEFALMYKACTSLQPVCGNRQNVQLKLIGLDAEHSAPAFVYRDKDKTFIAFIGNIEVYQVSLKSVPYRKSLYSYSIQIRKETENSHLICIQTDKHMLKTMTVDASNSHQYFNRPDFIKVVEEI